MDFAFDSVVAYSFVGLAELVAVSLAVASSFDHEGTCAGARGQEGVRLDPLVLGLVRH